MGPSFCTTPIEIMSVDDPTQIHSRASGFFYELNGQPYLVTNYHVISGKNPLTGKHLNNETGFEPQEIQFYGLDYEMNDGDVVFKRKKWKLRFTDSTDKHLLFRDPPIVDGHVVDIWATPIEPKSVLQTDTSRTDFKKADTLSSCINQVTMSLSGYKAGDECFILGYPLHNYDGLNPPVWKRGSIASETSIGVGKPVFLVDASTLPSMSGSPIIAKRTLGINQLTGAPNDIYSIIGVYGGRLQNKDLQETNIGYGWYQTLIPDVLNYYEYSSIETIKVGN